LGHRLACVLNIKSFWAEMGATLILPVLDGKSNKDSNIDIGFITESYVNINIFYLLNIFHQFLAHSE